MLFYLKARTDVFTRNHRLLHFAPEASLVELLQKSANIEYLSADLDSHRAMERIDMTDIQYADETFSAILCSHVLEHIPDDHKAMSELRRVLTSDGWAILQVPVDVHRATTYEDFSIVSPEERAKHFGRFDHCRVYGGDYKDRLERAGFKVEVDKFVKSFPAAEIARYGLEDWEDVYVCRKSGN